MADVLPTYLQGSATGGLLQNLGAQQTAQQAGGGYTPGQGQAPLASAPMGAGAVTGGAMNAALNPANYQGLSDYEKNKLISLASGHDNFMKDQFLAGIASKGTVNVVPGGAAPAPAAAAGGAPGSNGVTTIGQGEAWLTPDELRAKTNALPTIGGNSGGGGGGSGDAAAGGAGAGGAGSGGSAGGGLNLAGTQGGAGVNASPGSLQQTTTPTGATVGYQDPGGLNSTNTVGFIGPSSTNGGGGNAGVLAMQPANAQNAVDAYKNTAGYQLMNDPSAYQQSPGYQYAMDQALGGVQNAASAHGMLESGAVLKSMQQTASGLAQQDYGNWWNRQNQLYGDYQNRLQGLAGGATGSADAMTAGANGAQASLQTGSNLGSLFGNQGTAGTGAIVNTAAAQSGNMINAGQQQASVSAANQATQLAGATLAANQQKTQQASGLF